MELNDLQGLIAANDFEKLKIAIEQEKMLMISSLGYGSDKGAAVYSFKHLSEFRKQYFPHFHNVMDTQLRPDKLITTDDGPNISKVARLPIPLQQLIVSRAAAFLCGNPICREATADGTDEEDLLTVLDKIWTKNKLDYESKRLAKLQMSETETAELWFTEEIKDDAYWKDTPIVGTKYALRMKVLAHSLGDLLYPVFNAAGDMIAFARSYRNYSSLHGRILENLDIYTDTVNYFADNSAGHIQYVRHEKNTLGKIPVIYYSQPFPEWFYVQSLIDRYEEMQSNHADTNDYNGSPIIKINGTVKGFSKKGERGKMIEIEGKDGDANYLSWDQSVGSLELEYKNLRSLIFDMTDTPDISMEQMKSIGTFSGIALKMLFLNAHLKAADKEENFGKSIQRRLNFLKSAIGKLSTKLEAGTSVDIKPRFEYFIPKDDKNTIDLLTEAVGGGILSKKSAIERNPLVSDVDEEIKQLAEEKNAEPSLNTLLNTN